MRTSRSFQLYTTFLILCFSTFTTAWPWPKWLPELDALVVRDTSSSSSSAPSQTSNSPTAKATGSSNSDTVSQTGSKTQSKTASKDSSSTNKNSGSAATTSGSSNSDSPSSNSTTKAATTVFSTSFDPTFPAGGIQLLTPGIASGSQYFKIGDYVTFVWNYTSLQATPTAVDILATCTANQQLYTIAVNQTVPANSTQEVVWDTGAYQATAVSDPLLTETYTLIIYDADSSISAVAAPGYLSAFDNYAFGMYTGQPYTPLNEYKCATCSGALSDMERRALGMVLGVSVVTVLSFTWFVGGTGVIW